MKDFRFGIEKDFEYFVKHIPKLEPTEFCGLAKVLSVPMVKPIETLDMTPEDLKGLNEERAREIVDKLTRPMDEVLEQMMDRYLSLTKKRRKEINQILKDIQRGR